MRRSISISAVVLLVMALSACASGPTFSELADSMTPLSPEKGRIYLYRSGSYGMIVQPNVRLNGNVIGEAVPRGFFFVDVMPGNYEISTQTEVERKLTLTLDKGQIRFVRLNMSIGFLVGHVYPELMEQADAMEEITSCHYIGQPL